MHDQYSIIQIPLINDDYSSCYNVNYNYLINIITIAQDYYSNTIYAYEDVCNIYMN